MSQGSGYPQRLKVLFANHTGKVGGAEVSLLTLLEVLASSHGDKVELIIAAPDDGNLLERAKAIGVHAISTGRIRRLRRPKSASEFITVAMALTRGIADAIQTLRIASPHIVYCNSLQSALYFALPAALKRMPIIWHCRDLLMPHSIAKLVGMLSSAVIAISNSVAKALFEHGVPRGKVRVIYNAVNAAQFEHPCESAVREFRKRCGVPNGCLLVGMVAHIVPWKRHDIFVRMASMISRHYRDVRFVIVGGDIFGEHEQWLKQLMQLSSELSLNDKLAFVGAQTDMATVMNAIDILVHPSPMEPFGRAIIEAMAAGKAVIAVNSFGPAEVISDGENGLLVPTATPEAFAHAVTRLIEDEALRERIGRAARKFVIERFSPQLHAEAILRLWFELLGMKASQANGSREQHQT